MCVIFGQRPYDHIDTHLSSNVFGETPLSREGCYGVEDNTEHIQPMEDDALTEDDEVLALNVLESEDHTEDEQILTQHVILEQEDKTPSPIATKLSSEVTKPSAFSTSSSSSSSSSTANLISGSAQGGATVSTRIHVGTALAQVQVSDTTHPRSPMTKGRLRPRK